MSESEQRRIAAQAGDDPVYTIELQLLRFDTGYGPDDAVTLPPVVVNRRLLMTTVSEAYAQETLIGLTRRLTGGGAGLEG